MVAEVSAQVAQAQTIVLAEYRGIEVGDITRLRANARKSGVYFHVLKNTLARRAVQGTRSKHWRKNGRAVVYASAPMLLRPRKWCMTLLRSNEKLVVKRVLTMARCWMMRAFPPWVPCRQGSSVGATAWFVAIAAFRFCTRAERCGRKKLHAA